MVPGGANDERLQFGSGFGDRATVAMKNDFVPSISLWSRTEMREGMSRLVRVGQVAKTAGPQWAGSRPTAGKATPIRSWYNYIATSGVERPHQLHLHTLTSLIVLPVMDTKRVHEAEHPQFLVKNFIHLSFGYFFDLCILYLQPFFWRSCIGP